MCSCPRGRCHHKLRILEAHEEIDSVTGEIYVTSPEEPLAETITAVVLAWPIFFIAICMALSIRF